MLSNNKGREGRHRRADLEEDMFSLRHEAMGSRQMKRVEMIPWRGEESEGQGQSHRVAGM